MPRRCSTCASQHLCVDHSNFEWARGNAHTNTHETYFSIFWLGLLGVYQHLGKKLLGRYLSEFDFRSNIRAKLGINDTLRSAIAVQSAQGMRLIDKTPH